MKNLLKKINNKLFLFTMIGAFVGIIFFAGAGGAIKATDTPDFCSSCHVYEHVITNFESSNHASLKCNDCHTPSDSIVAKYYFKSVNAVSHGYKTTIGASNIPDVISASEKSKEIIQKNCISCHEAGLENISHGAKETCIGCHRQVPHKKGNFRPAEWSEPGNYDFNR